MRRPWECPDNCPNRKEGNARVRLQVLTYVKRKGETKR